MSDDLLDRMPFAASTHPAHVERQDMLELLERAGLGGSHVHEVIAAQPEGRVLVDGHGLQAALRMAKAKVGGARRGSRRSQSSGLVLANRANSCSD